MLCRMRGRLVSEGLSLSSPRLADNGGSCRAGTTLETVSSIWTAVPQSTVSVVIEYLHLAVHLRHRWSIGSELRWTLFALRVLVLP